LRRELQLLLGAAVLPASDVRFTAWRNLTQHAGERRTSGRFLVEGLRAVERMLADPHYTLEWVLVELETLSARGPEILARSLDLLRAVQASGCPLQPIARSELRQLAGTARPRGLLAIARRSTGDCAALLARLVPTRGIGVVAAGITDAGNLGALLRSAHAFGASCLFTCCGTIDALHPKVIRACTGHLVATAEVEWSELHASCTTQAIELLVFDSAVAAMDLTELQPKLAPRLLVLGGERGLPPAIAQSGRRVSIAMRPGSDSLNVAVAGSIALWYLQPPRETNTEPPAHSSAPT
jgi:tRNA G18 (ribose-2'-O)-methylase SpoU